MRVTQDRVTDHRVGMTINHVEGFMEGDGSMLSEMIDALVEDHNKKELELFIQRLESSADKNTVK